MHNDVVKSDIHSTDTHGYSEAIFGLTHMLGFSFAPRLKSLHNQQLYIFKYHSKEEQKDWKIVPDHYVNEKLLHQNWDDFLRLVTTIKLKENNASDIFQRLNFKAAFSISDSKSLRTNYKIVIHSSLSG
jgi:TnpA family transposase